MKYRMLGNTNLEVSEIGFGAWGIGGDSYGPPDDDASREALHLAFNLGINTFDTSDAYGQGHSEELIGQALGDVRQEIILTTKVGALPHFGFQMPQDFSPAHLRAALEGSLMRLRTHYIDVYQLHSPPIDLLKEDGGILEILRAFKDEGKVRVVGISARSPDDGLVAARELGVEAVQVNLNLIDQRALQNGLLDYCRESGVGVIARTPFCFGFLTGNYSPGVRFGDLDHRSNWPQAQINRWAEAPRLFSGVCPPESRTMAQMALTFCLAHDTVSTVIPGMMNCDEVRENVAASDLDPLSESELSEIRAIYHSNDVYSGREALE